jgi:hypothetical protein
MVKAKNPPGMLQRVQQAVHPRRGNRQRPAASTLPGRPGRLKAQVKHALPHGQPLPRRGLQQLHPCVIVSRTDVLDIPRPAMEGVHDLHGHRTRRRLHRPDIRHRASLRARD